MRSLESYREEFPITRDWAYLNHAATSPIPQRVADAMKAAVDGLVRRGKMSSTLIVEGFRRCRANAAKLLNVEPDDVAFVPNTTEPIAYVANGLEWLDGDNVLLADIEYPANVYPWWAQERKGVELRWVKSEEGRLRVQDFAAAITERTRVLAVSTVEFSTGFRNDVAALGELCRERGVLLVVDAIQSLGALRLDAKAANIDVLACGGHKWLLSTAGAGLMYCRRDIIDRLGAANAGAGSMVNVEPYLDYRFEPRPDARRFESGSSNVVGIIGLGAALELLNEVGPANIEERSRRLTDRACEGLRSKGYSIYSSREEREWSGIVMFECGGHDGREIVKSLAEQKICISLRAGRLRMAPHFYNNEADIDRCIAALPPVG